jgi:hypothetical protein
MGRGLTLANSNVIMLALSLLPDEATALAQFVNRIDYDTVGRFTSASAAYGSRSEHEVAWAALNLLRSAFAQVGIEQR